MTETADIFDTTVHVVDALFDTHRNALANFPAPGLEPSDIINFCDAMGVLFYASGEPGDWDNAEVFRVSVADEPSYTKTIPLSKVREWKQACSLVSDGPYTDCVYVHHSTRAHYTVLCEGIDTDTHRQMVIYKNNESGQVYSRPKVEFLGVVTDKFGNFIPSFMPQSAEALVSRDCED